MSDEVDNDDNFVKGGKQGAAWSRCDDTGTMSARAKSGGDHDGSGRADDDNCDDEDDDNPDKMSDEVDNDNNL